MVQYVSAWELRALGERKLRVEGETKVGTSGWRMEWRWGERRQRSEGGERGWKEIGRMKVGCLKPWVYVVEQKLHSYGGMSYSRCMTQAMKKLSFLPLLSLLPPSPLPHYAYSIMLTHTHTHTQTLPGLNIVTFVTYRWLKCIISDYLLHCTISALDTAMMIALSTAEVVQRLASLVLLQCRRQSHTASSVFVSVSFPLLLPQTGGGLLYHVHDYVIPTCSSGALYKSKVGNFCW